MRRYSIDTGEYVLVETPHTTIEDVTWSPDGTMVALNADIPGEGRVRLYVLDVGQRPGLRRPAVRLTQKPAPAEAWAGEGLLRYVRTVAGDHHAAVHAPGA